MKDYLEESAKLGYLPKIYPIEFKFTISKHSWDSLHTELCVNVSGNDMSPYQEALYHLGKAICNRTVHLDGFGTNKSSTKKDGICLSP